MVRRHNSRYDVKRATSAFKLVSLSVRKSSIVQQPFDLRLETRTRFKRRPFDRTVEENIEVDLQASDVFLDLSKLLVDPGGYLHTACLSIKAR